MKPLPLALFFVLTFVIMVVVQNFSHNDERAKKINNEASYDPGSSLQVSKLEIQEQPKFKR